MTTYSGRLAESDIRTTTLVELLGRRAASVPERLAYRFLADAVDAADSNNGYTYAELQRRARAVAAFLQQSGAAGERALLVYPAGLDYVAAFFGCLYAGVVAVPVQPLRLNRNAHRLQAICDDAGAAFALTTSALLSRLETAAAQEAHGLAQLRWLTTDTVPDEASADWQEPAIDGASLAYLQYTSGSTAAPKGVMVTHANVLHNSAAIHQGFGHTPQSVGLTWLPHFHDMGLIDGIIQPLYGGFPGLLMSPASFLQRPARWLEAVTRYSVTHTGGPNFAYDLCVRRTTEAQRAALDLGSWGVAYNGSEPVREETLHRFAEAFEPCGFRRNAFYPAYGLAEATLKVTGGRRGEGAHICTVRADALAQNRVVEATRETEGTRTLVGSGRAEFETKVVIVNPETRVRSAPAEVGEIWASGSGIAAGYWNRPEETERTFSARLADADEGEFLRTGDLGFIREGELFVTGRLKELIIIRGRNLYPQDIETAVERCDASLRAGGGAAFPVETAGEERLVVVQELEPRSQPDAPGVIEAIRETLAEEFEVQPYAILLVKAGSVPKTSSGKKQRGLCREKFLSNAFDVAAQWRAQVETDSVEAETAEATAGAAADAPNAEAIQAWLRARLAAKLGVDAESIGVNHPLTRYGVDSLLAIELTHAVETRYGVSLSLADFLSSPSLAQLAARACEQLKATPQAATTAVHTSPETQAHPLSHGQQSLWFLHRLAPESAAYNVAAALKITSPLDAHALRRAFQTLVERHVSLRTRFEASAEGVPAQIVESRAEIPFSVEDATSLSDAQLGERLTASAHEPFDLAQGALLRVSLFERTGGEHVLLVAAHHVVVDLWSLAVLIHELGALYAAETNGAHASLLPPPATAAYTAYVRREQELLSSEEGARLAAFWQKELAGELSPLDLHTDRPRPPVQTYNGASESARLDAHLTARLKALSCEHDSTLYTTLLAAFHTLLYRYTGQQDLLVGSPTAGRPSAQFAETVGYFVNPVVLRARPDGELSFAEFLRQVRGTVLDAFAHQEYPFALLVKRLQAERDASRSPIFQAMFAFNKAHLLHEEGLSALALGEAGARMNLGGLALETFKLEQRIAQFDLSLTTAEAGDELLASLEYNTDLFDAATIRRMLGHFRTLLESIAEHPTQTLARLPLLTAGERQQLPHLWNVALPPQRVKGITTRESRAPESDVDAPPCVHELFERQSARAPAREAAVFEDERLSYGELNRRANQLARRLRARGVAPETPVAICLERSTQLVVALVAVLKAGGAYVPLDPRYPQERITSMLEDCGARVLITQTSLRGSLPPHEATVVCLDSEREAIEREDAEDLHVEISPDNLAYVIYTSGSTGKPKGVMVSHGSLARAHLGWKEAYGLDSPRSVLQMASFSFDVFTEDVCRSLLNGGKLVLCPQDTLFNPRELDELLRRERIEFADFVPAVLRSLVQHLEETGRRLDFMRAVVSGADSLYVDDYERLLSVCGDATRAVNSYGITEATIDNTIFESREDIDGDRIVPIGRPFAHVQTYLLDAQMQPVPVGVPGELYLGGAALARGYLKRPDLTAEKFLPDAFSVEAGARMYRTGDRALFLPDGNIHFLGRNDNQVKIRGQRIELGEIESALLAHPDVRAASVIARGERQEKRLVAYVVATADALPAEETAKSLRDFLRQRLPEHSSPSAFVFLDALPLNINGKLDRRALPPPDFSKQETRRSGLPPQTPTEHALARIWGELLRLESVGTTDNFFELGGDSILSIQVVARAKRESISLSPRDLFEHPTIAALAVVADENAKSSDTHESSAANVEPLHSLDGDAHPAFPLARLERRRAEELLRAHEGLADIYPLSPMQQGMLFHSLYAPETSIYLGQFSCTLEGRLDEGAFGEALRRMFARHEILRTSFVWEDLDEPLQLVHANLSLPLERHDWRSLSHDEQQARWLSLLEDERRRGFRLSTTPLIRLSLVRTGDESYLFAWTHHHLLLDGWSGSLLLRELFSDYEALKRGTEPHAPPRRPFRDFIEWLRGQDAGKAETFWREKLKGFDAPTPLVVERASTGAGEAASEERAEKHLRLSAEATRRLQSGARANRLTLNTLVQGAWALLLNRYSGEETVLFGATVAGRPPALAGVDSIVGLFINTLPVRVRVTEDEPVLEWLRRLQREQAESREYEHSPLADVQRFSEVPRGTSLFESLLVFENYPVDASALVEGVSLKLSGVRSFDHTNYPLTVIAMPGEEFSLQILYDRRRFDDDSIERMLGHLHTLLESIAADAAQTVSAVRLLTEDERRRLLVEWNDTARVYDEHLCMHEMFEAQARRTPASVAVADGRGGELTYAELNERANRLARYLRRLGVQPEARVGVCVERSVWMLVALLGVQKAGGAYVGLDPHYPQERIAYMLEDSGAQVLLTERHLVDALPAGGARLVCLDADWQSIAEESADDFGSGATARNLAYVIYTSGSTGMPKGTAIEHRSAVVFSHWARESFTPEEFAGVLGFSSICFDLSIFELFVPLHWGGKVVVVKDVLQISQLPAAHPVTLVNTVPSACGELLQLDYLPPTARTVNLAGEALPKKLVRQLYEKETVRRVFNLYGPTEDTTYSTWDLTRRDTEETPTIGRPISQTQVYLLDRRFSPVPVGVPGELYLGGAGLARGYLNRPDLTAGRFIPDPFGSQAGARLYRTGDLARYLPDGRIEYLGRLDHQVKILGFRIELGEIEYVLGQHPGVESCTVMAREDAPGDKRLVAYVVAAGGHEAAHHDLRSFLGARLPKHMLPSAFVVLDKLPLTPNGKINRRALPPPETARPALAELYVEPRDAIESALALLWQELLGLERVGVEDNFFELGGHSLLATRLLSKVRSLFRTELSLSAVFDSPTVAQLARALVSTEAKPGQTEKIARALQRVRSMSAEDLRGELERKRREKSNV